MIKQRILGLVLFLCSVFSLQAQTFVEAGSVYPLGVDDKKYAVSGFIPFNNLGDETIYANALLWTIENVCPKLRDGITEVNIPARSFACDFVLASLAGSGQNNIYYCRGVFRVADGKLVYYLSNILIESSVFVMKKVTPAERLTPEKKASHQQIVDDFVQVESLALNKMFDFVATNKFAEITHWDEIISRKPVKGMTEDECRLAFGKPQSVLETNGEVQWMYSSSFYLFFKDGLVYTIIK